MTDTPQKPPSLWQKAVMEWPVASAGWIADFGRLLGGAVTLNFRKTVFRRAKGRMRCPCQHPSDSGRAFETACDAAAPWARPRRFRRLCPLLVRGEGGQWRCSVNTADVRPFWGLAAAWLGGTALSLYLAAALVIFVFLRIVGYPVAYGTVVWPPAWHDIRIARASYFFDKAGAAFNARRPNEAMMDLSMSYELDPGNYAVGMDLAQATQRGWGELSDRIYKQLLRDHPEHAEETARAWFVGLLAEGDFAGLEKLAADRVATDSAWLNAFLFASRWTGDRTLLVKLAQSKPGALPPYVRGICAVEYELRTANVNRARFILTQPLPGSPPAFALYYLIDRDLHFRLTDEALVLLRRYGSRLDARDRLELTLEANWDEGWQSIVRTDTDKLLATQSSAPVVELISEFLIRHPDPYILQRLFDTVYRRPLAPDSDRLGAYESLFCAAGVQGDWVRLQAAAAELKSVTGSQFGALEAAEAYFRGTAQPRVTLSRCLRSLPGLPINVTYALYERENPL